ncbi:AfsR/SARP family transcriptional regulator [Streptomyces sp. NPDC050804]|uniref:AfsR/SARP family transcriptional regulator n=1 Tax=Streptomyces sp. NPDC050804 TaxID=3154745 RepID=UPI003443FABB
MAEALHFGLLGPVTARRGDREIPLGPPLRKAVLAVLLLREGTYVSPAELIKAVWGSAPPASALNSVHAHIHHLRRSLAGPGEDTDSLIRTVSSGYQLSPPPDSVDVGRFQRLLAVAERLCAEGHFAEAAQRLRDALRLWQGPPLAGMAGEYAERQRRLILPLRLTAVVERISADIASGAPAESVAELNRLISEHPLDERFRELLMLALFESGRQADALHVYSHARRTLANTLGVDPGPALQRLRERIVAGDPPGRPPAAAPGSPVRPPGSASVPRQLPAPPSFICARRAQLSEALSVVTRSAGSSVIIAIQGSAGMGKTTVGLNLAHQLAQRFPNGQLYADLGAFGPYAAPASPQDVLGQFLRALGVPTRGFRQRPEGQTSLFRSILSGRRLLILLENAQSAAQVRPLLPGARGSVVVVTSRGELSGLITREGAYHLPLGPLSAVDSRAVLRLRIGGKRASADPVAVHDLADHCGGSPLALSVVAAYAVTHERFPLAAIAAGIRDGSIDLSPALADLSPEDGVRPLSPGARTPVSSHCPRP